jgi:hypothetical protein
MGKPATQPAVGGARGALAVRLEDKHRWIGVGAALTAASCFAALWLPNLGRQATADATGTTFLAIGLALSALLAVASLTRRGVLMAAAALLVAVGPWGPEYLLMILFFVWALYLMGLTTRAARGKAARGTLFAWLEARRDRQGRPRPAASARYTPPLGRAAR